MVEVIYDGNLGNNLFQYCFGRILAERLKYKLRAQPIVGFPRTYDRVEGHDYSGKKILALRGQKPNLSFLKDGQQKYHLLLTGYFQRYEYYEEHAQRIRAWLTIEDDIKCDIGVNDVVLVIRRGRDYIPRHGLPVSYYENALALTKYDRVYICTNEPGDPYIQYFRRKFRAVVRQPGALDNLAFIKKFKKIVISNSTFVWWAGFLSNADEIIAPRPANGFWSPQDPLSKNISLEVSESRYKYLDCQKYKAEFLSEMIRNGFDEFIHGAKAGVKKVFPFVVRKRKEAKSTLVFSEDMDE